MWKPKLEYNNSWSKLDRESRVLAVDEVTLQVGHTEWYCTCYRL